MAISFDTVTGNQASSAVLSQINTNFTKIVEGSVASADNATKLNNKEASTYLPGATEFKQSITTTEFNNLTTGRYFCTQTEQSWEPLYTTTGTRSILLEVNIDTTHELKNYNLTYISGSGAGSKFYAYFDDDELKWMEVGGTSVLKDIDYYDDILIFKETNKLIDGYKINFINDSTRNSWTLNISCEYAGKEIISGVEKHKIKVTYNIILADEDDTTVKEYTFYDYIYGTSGSTYDDDDFSIGQIVGPLINQTTGDMILRATISTPSGFTLDESTYDTCFYCSALASNTASPLAIPFALDDGTNSYIFANELLGWYNNILYFNVLNTSAHTLTHQYIILDSTTRSTSYTSYTSVPTSGVTNLINGGQKDSKYYLFWVNNTSGMENNGITVSQINFDTLSPYPTVTTYNFLTSSLIAPDLYDFAFDSTGFYLSYIGVTVEESSESYYVQGAKITSDLSSIITSSQFTIDPSDINDIGSYIIVMSDYIALEFVGQEKILNKSDLSLAYAREIMRLPYFVLVDPTIEYHNPYIFNQYLNIGPIKYYNQVLILTHESFCTLNNDIVGGISWPANLSFEEGYGRAVFSIYITNKSIISYSPYVFNFLFSKYNVVNTQEQFIGNPITYHSMANLYSSLVQEEPSSSSSSTTLIYPFYIDGIGLCCCNYMLDTSDSKYMIKSIGI